MNDCSKIIWLAEVDSTNSYAKREFYRLDGGCLVATDNQTAGRGRRGRTWLSPPGRCLCASWVVKQAPARFAAVSWALALGSLDALRAHAPGVDFAIKWPNDIFVGGRKLAGMLCELVSDSGNRPLGVVAGIGVNLDLGESDLAFIDQPAASLSMAGGVRVNARNFAETLSKTLARCYIGCPSVSEAELRRRWKLENFLIGREIEIVTDGGGRETGVFSDVDEDGGLVLSSNGVVKVFHSGEVSLRPRGVR